MLDLEYSTQSVSYTHLPGDALAMSIISGDAKAIAKAQGIGNKTAQKIIIELKDKIDMDSVIGGTDYEEIPAAKGDFDDALEALVSLGSVSYTHLLWIFNLNCNSCRNKRKIRKQ